jgi:4-amino-4-deoxy-L-arabinose transferase-like glycosyltransferase
VTAVLDKILQGLERRWPWLLLALFALRAAFLFVNGLVLVGDESYYWDWSRRPDWCYFSKPPMVAWLIGAATGLGGDSAPVLRLPAVLLGTVALGYFHAAAKAFYGARAAGLAVLLLLATPNNVLANLIMTIDPPLYCFWIMCVYYLRRAIFDSRPWAWLWAGCAAGLALLSKQVGIALPIMLLVYILLDRRRYVWLKREFWWFLAPVLLALTPIVLWNRRHDWVMFGHSQSHFTGQDVSGFLNHLTNAATLFGYQLLLMSPLIGALAILLSARNVFFFKRLNAEQRFLTLLGPVLLIGVLLLSFKQKVQGNWPMPFYFTALLLLAGYFQAGQWRKFLNYALTTGFALVLVTYALPVLLHVFDLENTRLNPIRRFGSWQELAARIETHRREALPNESGSFVVALGHRNVASEMAFYLPGQPRVYRYEEDGAIVTQYELWPGPQADYQGRDALIVSEVQHPPPPEIKNAFRDFRWLAEVPNPKFGAPPYELYAGAGLQQWPARAAFPVYKGE